MFRFGLKLNREKTLNLEYENRSYWYLDTKS